ncbi:FAD-binding oxidoreductase [Limnothrix sp. FACHB-1083]|uniref:FAD-binding oxidoreductase n=1 Tax=unclassified Limnothrix TaxID=2632864 RepID=UPI00168154CA|nr:MULTISPECIES: FAD-binding oxidoreductase [unclassified Limnothrix]MBD2159609.1 FAD-binding oxidoreductase [Limnothrix sp. FACHB-1083]MBD2190311.1 FAD-binding oxidoreductase [Limnothrix sp. FACHB-1088]
MSLTADLLSTIPGQPLAGLARADRLWQQLRGLDDRGGKPPISVIYESSQNLADDPDNLPPANALMVDLVVLGGTLGIVMATALAQAGWRVVLMERGQLQGRDQEWNISRSELAVLVERGLLTAAELERAIASEFNPVRIAFAGGQERWVRDVLNLGVSPAILVAQLRQKFLAAGGILLEQTQFVSLTVQPDRVWVQGRSLLGGPTGATGAGGNAAYGDWVTAHQATVTIGARLVLDAMGHQSPIVRQTRGPAKPDGVCLVVGTCATGYPANDSADLIATTTGIQDDRQYFWEAFPAQAGRTTYLFCYGDAHPSRPSLHDLFEDYFRLLPAYQNLPSLEGLQFQRALFGFFPAFRQSPLQPTVDRLLFIGDSSGLQSPLSFGGFGALLRHLDRLLDGITNALQTDRLDRSHLSLLLPYQPNLSVTWLFQQAMRVAVGQQLPSDRINRLLDAVFGEMAAAGDRVLRPFLQDVVQFPALSIALARVAIAQPALVAQLIPQLGLPALLDWMRHYLALGLYHAGDRLALPARKPVRSAWRYGSGNDWHP